MGEKATDVLKRIKRNTQSRDYCLAVLDLWAHVQEQGIEIEAVESFGFDEKFLSAADKQKAHKHWLRTQSNLFVTRLPNGRHRLNVYNYVRLKDGSVVTLSPVLDAPPDDPEKEAA